MAQVTVKFAAQTSGFSKGIAAVRAGIGGLAATVGTVMAPLAALVSLGAALGAVFKGVSLAAEAESMEASFTTMLGSGEKAKAMLKDIKDLGARTPFEFPDLAQAARSLMAGGQKTGIIQTLTTLGDLASVAQKPVAELASIYSKIRGGGILNAEDLNQLTDNGIPILQEFSRMLGVSVMEVRKLGSESKLTADMMDQAFAAMTSRGGVAFNAMTLQSKTFSGLLSTLKDGWSALLVEFGKPVMNALKPLLSDGISLLDGLQQKARIFGEAVGASINFLRNAFKGGELLSLLGSGLLLVGQSFVNLIVKGLSAAGSVILNAFMAAGNLLFGIFSNGAMWDALRANFDVVGLKIQRAIIEAVPDVWQKDKQGSLASLDYRIGSREDSAELYGAGAARKNAEMFHAAADALRDSGKVFTSAFKSTGNVFDTSGLLKSLQERWNALSRPPAAPVAGEGEKGKAPAPKAPAKQAAALEAQFEPVLSSLARIGGARAFTSNPLVALQQTANGYLETIARNSGRGSAAVLA